MAPAAFAVSWAGESESANWFDTARELTERWHHQAQIRLALDRLPALTTPALYHPVLDCFIRVLPHAYRHVDAPDGTVLSLRIDGAAGGTWHLRRDTGDAGRWYLSAASTDSTEASARVVIPETLAWRLFTKGLSREEAQHALDIDGDRRLALPLLAAVAIVG